MSRQKKLKKYLMFLKILIIKKIFNSFNILIVYLDHNLLYANFSNVF